MCPALSGCLLLCVAGLRLVARQLSGGNFRRHSILERFVFHVLVAIVIAHDYGHRYSARGLISLDEQRRCLELNETLRSILPRRPRRRRPCTPGATAHFGGRNENRVSSVQSTEDARSAMSRRCSTSAGSSSGCLRQSFLQATSSPSARSRFLDDHSRLVDHFDEDRPDFTQDGGLVTDRAVVEATLPEERHKWRNHSTSSDSDPNRFQHRQQRGRTFPKLGIAVMRSPGPARVRVEAR